MSHELKGIDRLSATSLGQILLLSLLSALVLAFFVWCMSRKRKGPVKRPPTERLKAKGRLSRKGASR